MVEISKELKFPMLAGSSVPVAYRVPSIDTPFGAAQKYAVAISYSGLDIYGFHVLEALQCVVERRQGGESGVRSVQCLEKQDCWNFLERNGSARRGSTRRSAPPAASRARTRPRRPDLSSGRERPGKGSGNLSG